MCFADFLKYAMEKTELTNYKLAKMLEISQTTVANWLEGHTEPRSKKRKEVFDLFGVSETELNNGLPNCTLVVNEKKEKSPTGNGRTLTPENYKIAYSEMSTADLYAMLSEITQELQGRTKYEQ